MSSHCLQNKWKLSKFLFNVLHDQSWTSNFQFFFLYRPILTPIKLSCSVDPFIIAPTFTFSLLFNEFSETCHYLKYSRNLFILRMPSMTCPVWDFFSLTPNFPLASAGTQVYSLLSSIKCTNPFWPLSFSTCWKNSPASPGSCLLTNSTLHFPG